MNRTVAKIIVLGTTTVAGLLFISLLIALISAALAGNTPAREMLGIIGGFLVAVGWIILFAHAAEQLNEKTR
jgi:hypothetical protein